MEESGPVFMFLVFQTPDTNNHPGWEAAEQFRAPLGMGQQLRALSEACVWTFLSRGQILQTWTGFYERQFF